ncbi:MAG: hypothetical protein E6H08_12425 [Bacteroidetes bacterium]|nr:MAG: hypothetical protein E6H08_12425 [Bacteroidota bacterium]
MKKRLLQLFIVPVIVFGVFSCSSKSGGGGGGSDEANLVVTLNPPAGSTQPAAPQIDFPLTVSITSTMPPQGVTIDVKAAPDGSATNFFTESKSSTAANNNFTITGTPTGVVSVVTVTVTSKTKATNTVTLSYRYTRKP